jgi:signal transduction histidine kinase
MAAQCVAQPMNEPFAKRDPLTTYATIVGGYALFGSFVSFLGWPLDIPRLTDWFNDSVSIQPNACVLIMVSGAAIMLAQWRVWCSVTVLGALAGVGGTLILLQYIIGVDFGINDFLLFDRTWGQGTTLTPGRVGPPASISGVLIGTALVLLGVAELRPELAILRRLVPTIGIAVCGITAFSLFGFLFGAESFYTIPWLTAIAAPTATMLLALGIGLVLSVPEREPMLLLREKSAAGAIARVVIPALLVMIPLVLWFRVQGYEYGFYDLGTGRALGALALVTVELAVLWIALMALRRHEQALKEMNEHKDAFLATLAHELRNPLAPLTNALEILSISGGDKGRANNARAMISRQLRVLVRLVDDLLDVSRINRGRVELRKERLELSSVLQETIDSIRPICRAAQQKLTIELPPEPVWIKADRIRLAQIVFNLLSNASRYSDVGAPIRIHASRDGGDIIVRVKDQ